MKTSLFPVTGAVTLFIAVSACTSSSDDHGHDAADGGVDAPDSAAPESGSVDASPDVPGTPDAAACTPACSVNEVCCVDAHGHFPTCRPGPTCP